MRATILGLLAFLTPVLRAQLPLGAEFRVNTYTTFSQSSPAIASDSSNNFVLVWSGQGQDVPGFGGGGIFGQRYASSGAPLGGEFRVNTYTTNDQNAPSIACDSAGNFVVIWSSGGQDGSSYGIFGQRYASTGSRLGIEFEVNTYTTNIQDSPAVAASPAGSFVVVWRSTGEDGSGTGVFGQRFTSLGTPAGAEFQVNTYTTSGQGGPAVASSGLGDFVVVWHSNGGPGESGYGVFGQRYSSAGAPQGGEFRVNTITTLGQASPSVAADSTGNFVVVWNGGAGDGSGYGIFGQRYDGSGARLGAEFPVNMYSSNGQLGPAVAVDSTGSFVVTWISAGEDLSGYGIFGQRYTSIGARLGNEFRVNTFTFMSQLAPAVTFGTAGTFVVAWQSYGQDFSFDGVFAQRFCFLELTGVSVSTMGSLTVCPSQLGGTATVTDTGGGTNLHQWVYRTSPGGMDTAITGQTGSTYVVNGAHFAFGTPGSYYLYCVTTPACGTPTYSAETVIVTVTADVTPPSVTSPAALTVRQSLCQ